MSTPTNVTVFVNEPDIIRFSNVVLSEGLLPVRVVLRDLGDQFVVHNELMVITAQARDDGCIELQCGHYAYDQGEYFRWKPEGYTGFNNYPHKVTALEEARQAFNERCAKKGLR